MVFMWEQAPARETGRPAQARLGRLTRSRGVKLGILAAAQLDFWGNGRLSTLYHGSEFPF
jgi:hypothetical protein